MKKPEFTRIFNCQHAKSGAPYGCANGDRAVVSKWDARGHYLLLGAQSSDKADWPALWSTGGKGGPSSDDLIMLPLGFVEGEPVFVGDQMCIVGTGGVFVATPETDKFHLSGCTWPAPAKPYPKTLMLYDDFAAAVAGRQLASISIHAAEAIANAALKHAIDAGQVVERNTECLSPDELHNLMVAFGDHLRDMCLDRTSFGLAAHTQIKAFDISSIVKDWKSA